MKSDNGLIKADFESAFTAYQPMLKPMGASKGGGYQLVLNLSESEWEAVKDINDPRLQSMILTVGIVGKIVK